MKPRPFFRWKSFWLGLCVLVFVGWAWWDSYRHLVVAYAVKDGREFEFRRENGFTYFDRYPDVEGPLELHFSYERHTGGYPLTVEYLAEHAEGYFLISDSLVFFSSCGLWSAWIFWHWKREQKKSP